MTTMNRMHNAHNPHQGPEMRVLCVCSAGLLRSPTAAHVLHDEYGYNTRAAGLVKDYALIYADDVLLHWADRIVCMNSAQKTELLARLTGLSKPNWVVNLGIDDSYEYMDPNLVKLISERYAAALDDDGEV